MDEGQCSDLLDIAKMALKVITHVNGHVDQRYAKIQQISDAITRAEGGDMGKTVWERHPEL
jgi:hypothetical protein